MELWSTINRADLQKIIEIILRTRQGTAITRPFGSYKKFDDVYDNLILVPSQMINHPEPGDIPVDMKVTLGPKAAKPLVVTIPLLISGMAYGLALSEPAKRALARGAKKAGTAICSGEGPYLAEERLEADKYILQICPWSWGLRTEQEIASADMLEVLINQGAPMRSSYLNRQEIQGKARKLMDLTPNQEISNLPAPPGVQSVSDWPGLVNNLRQRANGIPIGLKMMASGNLEEDLAFAIDLGFDVIAIVGAHGGSFLSTPTIQDDFGIPSLHALVRAIRYLKSRGVRDQVSLIVAGGYYNPESCLKALALGADAIYLATVPLYALVKKQHKKLLPLESPSTFLSYSSKYNQKVDIALGANRVSYVLRSMVVEMEQVIRALGKSSIKDLNPDDLVALDSFSAEVAGVKRTY